MRPNPYQSPSASQTRRERPQLTLIPGEGRPRRPKQRLVLVALALALAASFFFMGKTTAPGASENALALQKQFNALARTYRQEGMLTFLQAKARLKLQVADALKEKDETTSELAENLAVFLFPDLLGDDDFEKSVAVENWAKVQAAIESTPRSRQSRARYQELQAAIWQYENPDAKDPALSPVASEVLKLYQAIAAP